MLFDDGKEPGALRTIGEVAAALGIRQHVLRYWEEQFPMLRPVKRSGGRRYYRPEDIALVARIDSLVHQEGYTLRGARALIAGEKGAARVVPMAAQPELTLPEPAQAEPALANGIADDRLAQLRAIRERLATALLAG